MNYATKFVVAMLSFALFGMPVMAAVTCSPKAAAHGDGVHCQIMNAGQQCAAQASESRSGHGPCCQISNLPSGMTQPAAKTVNRASIQVAVSYAEFIGHSIQSTPAPATAPFLVITAGPSTQALLCTFLV